MLHLTLIGVSEDNTRLLLVSDKGEQFSLAIDARLRAALRGEHAPPGKWEMKMESALRPKDIQARIRAGESPEQVAQAAQTSVERIMAFANPVLAERAHVAQRAQLSSVRRRPGDAVGAGGAGGARTLGESVATHVRPLGVDPDKVEWDAWRREDGRWSLTAQYAVGKRRGLAKFAFDVPGNYVVTENDDARWLVGEAVKPAVERRDDLEQARKRKAAGRAQADRPASRDDEQAVWDDADDDLGSDALQLVAEPGDSDEVTVDLSDTAARIRETGSVEPDLSPTPEPMAEEVVAQAHEAPHAAAEPATQRPAKRRGRASVPSWDEIMFGGKSE